MPDVSVDERAIMRAILARFGRATLPIQEAHTAERRGTAFWFDELIDATPGDRKTRQYLVTADALTRCDLGELLLRPALCDPPVNADLLLLPGFADLWMRPAGLGIAAMPTDALHAHGTRKGWRWTTDDITDDVAAREADVARAAERPTAVFILGHEVSRPDVHKATARTTSVDRPIPTPASATAPAPISPERPQTVTPARAIRAADGVIRVYGDVPQGLVGAPVFTVLPRPDDDAALVCLGMVLPAAPAVPGGPARHPIAPFDVIRAALPLLSPPPTSPRRRWPRRS
jgi:hypothetical protein